ncbi:DUF669 domain-containing protein [Priestia megaterium]|uniref:DUF669 domain-containing protein n=1 Tax=Priestia megaterium TaxID=1404 RepID=UPI002E1C85C6|nr:DUF669 domain-containing protein [Priestia megaterium]
MDYSKFDNMMDLDGLMKDIEEASQNSGSGDYKEVPFGTYEVKVEKLELVESKKGDPMVSIWFKILAGDFKNSLIFMNQVITQGFQVHIANEFLRSLDSGLDVEFKSYSQYGQLLMDIHEAVDGKLEYVLEYGQNKKGFNTYAIKDIFEVE